MPHACGFTSFASFSSNGRQNGCIFFGLSGLFWLGDEEFSAFSLFQG
jgi:hypothetical protein